MRTPTAATKTPGGKRGVSAFNKLTLFTGKIALHTKDSGANRMARI